MASLRSRALGALLALSASFATNGANAAPPKPPSCPPTAPPLADDATADALFQRGLCEESEGHLIAAVKLYQTALRRPSSPALARRLKVRSDEVVARLASVRIEASSLPDGATALVASKKYELGSKRFVDPGKVEIEVSAPGYVTRTVTVDVGEGEQRVVTVILAPVTSAEPPPAPALKEDSVPDKPPPRLEPPPPANPWRPAGYVALGVGGAALIAGGITGYLAFDRADEVQSQCPTKTTCTADGAAAARAGSTFSTVSTVTTIAGAVLAAGGLALVLWGGPATVRPTVGAMNGLVLTGKM
jgi:hypothetical protein